MANDKKFVVKNGLTTSNIEFKDDINNGTNTITASMLSTDALSFSGDSGQLFSITDSLTGTIFSVNDISGIPSVEVDDDGTIRLAEFTGNVLIGTATDDGSNKLQLTGDAKITGNFETTGNISVTGTVDGRDIAADGTKLDGIESGATADQTAAEILTAIKTVDGSGSGLDADLLDGQQGSYYLDYNNLSNTPGSGAARTEEFPTVTNGSAAVTMNGNYAIDKIDVFLNGAKMKGGTDYTVSGTTLTFSENLQTGDVVALYVFNTDVLITADWNDLNDVSVTGASANDLVRYNGSSWVIAPASIDSSGNLSISGTVDGRDIAADGSKLDGIESGATADQTASEILTAIKTVDGSGSGLDADTVDGIEAAAITQSGDTVALTGDVTGSTTVAADGTISVATTIAANSVALGTDTTGNYVATVTGTANEVEVTGSGSETAAVTVGLPSDVTVSNNLTVGGYIAGPSTFTIDPAGVGDNTGTVVIAGDLQVGGTTITVNSQEVAVGDKVITLGSDATADTQNNGAGIKVYRPDSFDASFLWDETNDEWDLNTNFNISGNLSISGTVDGRDVAADGSKLDGIESGATADQTASEILTAIKTVDGSGSGLDADTVDGLQASSFIRSDANDTSSGDITFNGWSYFNVAGQNVVLQSDTLTRNTLEWQQNTNRVWVLDLQADGDLNFDATGTENVLINNNRILTTADEGTGNGLDADTVDGLQASSFIRSDADDTMTGNLSLQGNLLLTGTPTATNQARTIDFTGFDKEGTTDFSDRAYIQHTTNTGGHSGSVLVISSQNDTNDGIAFSTNASSYLKRNGNTIWDAGNDGSGSGLDADLLDGQHGSYYQNAGNLNAGTLPAARLTEALGTYQIDPLISTNQGRYSSLSVPTMSMAAIVDPAIENKMQFQVPSSVEVSTDNGSTYSTLSVSSNDLKDLVSGTGTGGGITISDQSYTQLRLTWNYSDFNYGYVYLNYLHYYTSPKRNTIAPTIEARDFTSQTFSTIESGSAHGGWPTHIWMPHNAIAFLNSAGRNDVVRITWDLTWDTGNSDSIQITKLNWYGTYPVASHNRVSSWDRDGNMSVTNGLSVTDNITVGGTVDGRDVAADGTKLDGIETGATADQTASEILTLIKTVDGSGSGLDADLLSGVQSVNYARRDTTNDFASTQRILSGTQVNHAFETSASIATYRSDAPTWRLWQPTSSGAQITSVDGAQVELAYNSGKRLETTSAGVTVSGDITVSGTVDGRDVATDGSKLDGIESGATADQTASEILTAIKTVDGSGSGLDADTLDGQEGTYYLDGANFTGTLPNNYVTLGTMTTGNYVGTVTGTTNQVDVTGSGSETAAVTVSLPDTVTLGSDDTSKGSLYLYGDGTGSAFGGFIRLYNPADHDTTNDYYTIKAQSNQFIVEKADGTDLFTYIDSDTSFRFPDGTVYVGSPDNTKGNLYIQGDGAGSVNGGEIRIYNAADHDTNVNYYSLYAESEDFLISYGSTDFLQYDYSASKWVMPQSGGLSVTGNITVSGTVDGRDVATDGTKLDGIEAGATADQTASEILTAIKTVDGTGSGLDADTVDGVEASSFLRSDAADTATGLITLNGGLVVSGASTAIISRGTDSETVFQSTNESASNANQFYIQHNLGNVNIGNSRGNINFNAGTLQYGGNTVLTEASTQSKYLRSDTNDDFSGTLNYTPDTGTILSVDGQAILQRMTANGAITIGHDDAVIIAGGDTSDVLNTNINNATETIFLGAEGGLVIYAFPNNDTTWTNRKTLSFDGVNGLDMNSVFAVDISGNLSAATKSFVIDHPTKEGMKLRHGSLEGPENGVYVRGRLTNSNTIELPEYWLGLVDEDSITVQLTAIGTQQNPWVKKIVNNTIVIETDAEIDCFYMINAERKDVKRFEVEYEV